MDRAITLIVNNRQVSEIVPPAMTLLDFLRRRLHLMGTKEVCREGDCGACSVLIGEGEKDRVTYRSVTSCIFPVIKAAGKHVVTIEGLNRRGLNFLQREFLAEGATQCGFCTPGFLVSLSGYLLTHEDYSHQEAINALAGNICRCTGYLSIERATRKIVDQLQAANLSSRQKLEYLVDQQVLPPYFTNIARRLSDLPNQTYDESVPSDGKAYLMAGGSDLYVQKEEEISKSPLLFLDSRVFSYIERDGREIVIGGGTTFEAIRHSTLLQKYIPRLPDYLNLVASLPVRNSATVAGNIVNASPIADLTILFLALEARLILKSAQRERSLPLHKFYLGYKKLDKSSEEVLTEIRFTEPPDSFRFNFEKVSKRMHLDIASVNSAFSVTLAEDKIAEVRISAGGVAPVPLLLSETNTYLKDREISTSTVEEALKIANQEISPITDIRGSAQYKRLLLRQLILAHFVTLFPDKIDLAAFV